MEGDKPQHTLKGFEGERDATITTINGGEGVGFLKQHKSSICGKNAWRPLNNSQIRNTSLLNYFFLSLQLKTINLTNESML